MEKAKMSEANRAAVAKYKQSHKARVAEASARYRRTHKDQIAASRRERKAADDETDAAYRQTHKAEIKTYHAIYYQANKAKCSAAAAAYRKTHKGQMKAYQATWNRANRENINKRRAAYCKAHKEELANRRKSNPNTRMIAFMSKSLRKTIHSGKQGASWTTLVPYTAKALLMHLRRLFEPEMTWQNYGTEWHIDHIIPLSAFRFTSAADEQFQQAWALSNLRPLWATTEIARKHGSVSIGNQNKNRKIDREWQPSLPLVHTKAKNLNA